MKNLSTYLTLMASLSMLPAVASPITENVNHPVRADINKCRLVASEFSDQGQHVEIMNYNMNPSLMDNRVYSGHQLLDKNQKAMQLTEAKTFVKGDRFRIGSPKLTAARNVEEDETETFYDVTFHFDIDMNEYSVQNILIFAPDFSAAAWGYIEGDEPVCVFGATAGAFCAFVRMDNNNGGPMVIIFKENMVVEGDMTINFDPADAANLQTFAQYTHAGELVKFPVVKWLDEDPYMETIETGNTNSIALDFSVYYGDACLATVFGEIGASILEDDGTIHSNENAYDFYINDVSDKVSVEQMRIATTIDNNMDIIKYDVVTIDGSRTFANDPADFLFYTPSFPDELYFSDFFAGGPVVKTETSTTYVMYRNYNGGYYIGKKPADRELIVIPARGEFETDYAWNTTNVSSTPLTNMGDGQFHYIIYPYSQHYLFSSYLAKEGGELAEATPSAFSFAESQLGGEFFQNVPIQVSTSNLKYEDTPEYYFPQFIWTYIGNNGEQNLCRARTSNVEFRHNGNVIASDVWEMEDKWNEDFFSNFADVDGSYDLVTSTDINLGEVVGRNTTVTHYVINGNSDCQSPTIQMLQLRKEDETVTTRFAEGDVVMLSVAGGDYKYNITEKWEEWFDYIPAPIKVEYSAYNANEWQELEVTANEELFYLPGFGDTYQGAICDLPASSNNWYDLRLTVVDAAGNSQQQTLTAAFKVDSAVGLSELKEQCNDATIYTLQGQKAAKQLSAGFYIANGKKIVKM